MENCPDICFFDATQLRSLIQKGDVGVEEVVDAHLSQIKRFNPLVNAVITQAREDALQQARKMDRNLKNRGEKGPLFGIPVLLKDLTLTKDIRTTFGSPIYRDHIPRIDSIVVERLKKAGAILLGKTNTPEFGAGSQTFNEVFGSTKNPYDLSKTCGGSSGGSAVSLACGFAPLADGSDFGGSLRNPASFCNVVGFRPSSGRVPVWPKQSGWFNLSVAGPMGRTVKDVALMLSVMAGPDHRDPLSLDTEGVKFSGPLEKKFNKVKVGWSPDLGGLPVDAEVLDVIQSKRKIFEDLGCIVEDVTPDLTDADEIFEVLRAWHYDLCFGELMRTHKTRMKDTVIWNIEQGQKLSGNDLAQVEKMRTILFHRVSNFFKDFDYLITPTVQVLPFDVDQPYVKRINGLDLKTYIEWMRSCYRISVTGMPSISVPCGFSKSGLPVGIQIVGGFRQDFSVLQIAHAFEARTLYSRKRPALEKISLN